MNHSFNTDIATALGMPCAVILEHIWFWVRKNEANGKHFHDGMYWTYNSIKAFSIQFPYLTAKQIRTALDKLRDEGILVVGNFNESAYDRTLWYALTEKGKAVCQSGQIHLPDTASPFALQGKPIPDINPDSKPIMTDEEDKSSSCPERSVDHSRQQPEEPAVFLLPLNDGTDYAVTQSEIDTYSQLYPAVDVAQEYRGMIGWLNANRANRKTRNGIKRFINNWLSKAQNQAQRKGGGSGAVTRGSAGESPRRLAGETIV